MALPRIDTPTYQVQIPSTGDTIHFRPFLVKEQKILMMAQESNQDQQSVDAVSKLVSACTFDKFDVINAPTFDVEYLFLQIRSKSVGESVDVNLICPDDDKTTVLTKINLSDIKIEFSDDHSNSLQITDTIRMVCKYPTLHDILRVGKLGETESIFKLLYRCIVEIHYGDEIYHRVDISDKDIEEFIDQLTGEQFDRVVKFFETMPRLKHRVIVTNPKTKVESEVILEGLQNFLG